MTEGKGVCVEKERVAAGAGRGKGRTEKGRTDKGGLVLSRCHTGDR